MNSETSIVLLGGDRRMAYAAQALRAFFPVHTLYLEEAYPCLEEKRTDPDQILPLCSICLLPVPAQRESFWVRTPEKEIDLRPLLRKLPVGARVLGGSFSAPLQAFFRQEGLSFFDYGKEEAFIEENARLTAEGVLPLLIERSPKALTDCSVSVSYTHLFQGQAAGGMVSVFAEAAAGCLSTACWDAAEYAADCHAMWGAIR